MKPGERAGFPLGMTVALVAGGAAGLEAQQAGDLLIAGGTLVVQGEVARASDILLAVSDRGLRVEAIGDAGAFQAADTVDASGSCVHTANGLSAAEPFRVGAHAMYVIRMGPSQGDPAQMLISSSGPARLDPYENHPEGPVHEAAGCYVAERGAWDPSPSQADRERRQVPEALRLAGQASPQQKRAHRR